MTSRGAPLLLGVAVLGAFIGAWWARRPSSDLPQPKAPVLEASRGGQPPENTVRTGESKPTGTAPSNAESPGDVQELRHWLSQEARGVGLQVDEAAHRRAIQQRVRTLTPAEWREVTRLILSPDENANERIVAAFMLGMGGLSAPDVLERVLDERLPEGPQRPHSEDEVRAMRERSLRLMVIDGLIAEAKADPGKRAALAQAIRRIDDPYLRDLAKRRAQAEGLE